jgi:hypothetical protein
MLADSSLQGIKHKIPAYLAHDRVFTNYLLPQQKQIFKQRHGTKVIKKHDIATTPHQRALRHQTVRKRATIGMNTEFKRIKPAALSIQILALTGQPETLALAEKRATIKPTVNRAWNC